MSSRPKYVVDVIAIMIKNWPTLYSTRMDCLNKIFNTLVDWNDGWPILNSVETETKYFDEPLDVKIKKASEEEYKDNNHRPKDEIQKFVNARILKIKREYNDNKFKRENAYIIAAARGYGNNFSSYPTFSLYSLNSIPLNKLNDEWKNVLIEYCDEIIQTNRLYIGDIMAQNHQYTEDYRNRIKLTVASAVDTAQEALSRLIPQEEDTKKRNNEISNIKNLAEKYGYKLVPINS